LTIKIGNRKIGSGYPIFIIAEAGVNYNNNLSLAYKMVDKAIEAGVDAIKFQTFVAEDIQLKNAIKPQYQKEIKNKTYFDILKENEPVFDHHLKIYNYCKKKGIIFLSTTTDEKGLNFLNNELKVPAFKIGVLDISNHLFLKKVLKTRKPIILSTGLSNMKEIEETIELVKKQNMLKKLVLLQTTSEYPTNNDEVNLRVIPEYQKKFHVLTGLSDHTTNHIACLGAVALGACMLEKHFTLSRKLKGVDQKASLEPHELKELVTLVRMMEKTLGSNKKFITKSEKKNLSMLKRITIKPMEKNMVITNEFLNAKRGNSKGILPTEKNIKKILGKKTNTIIKNEKQFSWSMIN